MACNITIESVEGTLPSPPSITITGTAEECVEVRVILQCKGEDTLEKTVPVIGGNWDVTFEDTTNILCACGEPVTINAMCTADPGCSATLTLDELPCPQECPEITDITVEIGECEEDPVDGKLKRKVTFTPTVTGTPTTYKWTWGDMTSDPTMAWPITPPPVSVHLYQVKPTAEPEFEIFGPFPPCGSETKTVSISEFDTFEPCECPEITKIDVEIGECVEDPEDAKLKREVKFTPTVTGPMPDAWEWKFGDGETDFGPGLPTADESTHLYETIPPDPPEFCIQGPDSCPDTCRDVPLSEFDTFEPCEEIECPEITDITAEIGECIDSTRTVTFTAVYSGPDPSAFEWDFGDGSAPESSTGSTSPPNTYDVPATPTVKVKSAGPGECEDEFEKTITLGSCNGPPPTCNGLVLAAVGFLAAGLLLLALAPCLGPAGPAVTTVGGLFVALYFILMTAFAVLVLLGSCEFDRCEVAGKHVAILGPLGILLVVLDFFDVFIFGTNCVAPLYTLYSVIMGVWGVIAGECLLTRRADVSR